jgi:hypothetical protein
MPVPPEWGAAPINDVLKAAMDQLIVKMEGVRALHPLEEAAFAIDQAQGIIVFTWRDGRRAQAPVQIIGAAMREDPSRNDVLHFKWSWDDQTVPAPLQSSAGLVRAFGAERGIEELAMGGVLRVHTDRAWGYLALAVALSDAQGAIRGPIGDNKEAFLTFGAIS